MTGILEGMRVVEGSAYVAAPLGGMTLAQLGADVIRFDPIGGGLDRNRWPVTEDGKSLFWTGMNKGKRSIQYGAIEARIQMPQIFQPGDAANLLAPRQAPQQNHQTAVGNRQISREDRAGADVRIVSLIVSAD